VKAQFFWLGWISHRSMFPQVSYSRPSAFVKSPGWVAAGQLPTYFWSIIIVVSLMPPSAGSIRGMGLGVRRCIACVTNRSLAVHSRTCHEATRLSGIVAALPILFEGSAANLLVFHKRQRICVVGMTAADG
jgi:hypothetical protein